MLTDGWMPTRNLRESAVSTRNGGELSYSWGRVPRDASHWSCIVGETRIRASRRGCFGRGTSNGRCTELIGEVEETPGIHVERSIVREIDTPVGPFQRARHERGPEAGCGCGP